MKHAEPFCDIYFTRHGETDWNVQRRMQGHSDIPLNSTGISQACRLGELLEHIPFTAAYSSDLSRARHTAELILGSRNLPVTPSADLRERNGGKLEGLDTEQVDQAIRSFFLSEQSLIKETYFNSAWHPEFETSQSILLRITSFLFPIIPNYHEQIVLVVTHGGVLRTLLDHLSFMPGQRWVVANCGFIKIRVEQETLWLLESHEVSQRKII